MEVSQEHLTDPTDSELAHGNPHCITTISKCNYYCFLLSTK